VTRAKRRLDITLKSCREVQIAKFMSCEKSSSFVAVLEREKSGKRKKCYRFREVNEKTVVEKKITVQRHDGIVL
jgi:hypothetical protein